MYFDGRHGKIWLSIIVEPFVDVFGDNGTGNVSQSMCPNPGQFGQAAFSIGVACQIAESLHHQWPIFTAITDRIKLEQQAIHPRRNRETMPIGGGNNRPHEVMSPNSLFACARSTAAAKRAASATTTCCPSSVKR